MPSLATMIETDKLRETAVLGKDSICLALSM
jgi:hypothetical protein